MQAAQLQSLTRHKGTSACVSAPGDVFSCVTLSGFSLYTGYCESWRKNDSEPRDSGRIPCRRSLLETSDGLARRLALASGRLLSIPEGQPVSWHPQWHFVLPTYLSPEADGSHFPLLLVWLPGCVQVRKALCCGFWKRCCLPVSFHFYVETCVFLSLLLKVLTIPHWYSVWWCGFPQEWFKEGLTSHIRLAFSDHRCADMNRCHNHCWFGLTAKQKPSKESTFQQHATN